MSAQEPQQNGSEKKLIHRQDYRPPDHQVEHIDLAFDIADSGCEVTAGMQVVRDSQATDDTLILYGRGQELLGVELDGRALDAGDYTLSDTELRIPALPARCRLSIRTRHDPDANTSLEGLYRSGDILCTQCEAHGFSRITYFPDRPDVLSTYRVSIEADKARYPVLLSNGNLLEQTELPDGRQRAVWEDPHPKPCYLFALVAGDLACVQDSYTTASGREVSIHFYVEHGDESRSAQAIDSLKAAMAWDEQTYGLEYDLDLYMVVAVGSFNMGAMENKGLNVFNSRYVLASGDTATDKDYENIQAVIGHEYFHNWTGNRVTCRDWFQLSLKEGLTVFREQQFMEDSLASSTQRLEQVRMLRSQQFAEDASPMAHPVRPESYIEVNNFYTLTVYEKGAEIIRMLQQHIGQAVFREGLRLYLQRHDGTAVTIDDFIAAMAEASGRDLGGFDCWYSQAGTPVLKVREAYEPDSGVYRLTFQQHTPATPGQPDKQPVPIPVRLGLLDRQGRPVDGQGDKSLLVAGERQQIEFDGLTDKPVPVLLKGFSAPVKLDYLYDRDSLKLIVAHEQDAYCRWDAIQRLYLDLIDQAMQGGESEGVDTLMPLLASLLNEDAGDPALIAELLRLPGETMLAEHYEPVPLDALIKARDAFEARVADELADAFAARYARLADSQPYAFNGEQAGRRRLRSLCLYYWSLGREEGRQAALTQYQRADNMTDALAALEALNDLDCEQRDAVMQAFAQRWAGDVLVMDKWLALQASSRLPGALQRVKALQAAEGFDANNPNRIRALVGSFCMHNMRGFHDAGGLGYQWLAEEVMRLDGVNPQVAARLCTPLCRWRRYDAERAQHMQSALRTIAAKSGLSADVYEIVSKALEQ